MTGIGGNNTIELQTMKTTVNDIGEHETTYETIQTIKGWLDMTSSGSDRDYDTKIADASNVFVSDYTPIDASVNPENPAKLSAVVEGRRYDVLYIDDPMKLHYQLEIYLKYTGGV